MKGGFSPQIEAANELERQGGLDLIALNALVAALATGDRLLEAEKYLKKALELTSSQGKVVQSADGKYAPSVLLNAFWHCLKSPGTFASLSVLWILKSLCNTLGFGTCSAENEAFTFKV